MSRRVRQALQLAGCALVLWLLARIGWGRIAAALGQTSAWGIAGVAALSLAAALARLQKLKALLPSLHEWEARVELFAFSRVGRELSQLGHLSPLLVPRFRNAQTVHALLVDRYYETLSTLALALLAACLHPLPGLELLRLALGVAVAALAALAFVRVPFVPRAGRWRDWSSRFEQLQADVRRTCVRRPSVVAWTLAATVFDFACVSVAFAALGVALDARLVPVVWAASGLAAALTLTSIGPAEYSTITLYARLAAVPDAVTVAMLVVVRGVSLAALSVFLAVPLVRRRTRAPLPDAPRGLAGTD